MRRLIDCNDHSDAVLAEIDPLRYAPQARLDQRFHAPSLFFLPGRGVSAPVSACRSLQGHSPRPILGLLAAFFLGALTVLAFAPFRAWWLAPVTLVALFVLVARVPEPREALALGFAFGLGLNTFGVSWIYISLHHVGGMPAPLAAVALLGFCGYLSLYPAVAAWLIRRWATVGAWIFVTVAPALWVLFEWLKATVMTGFPWLNVGTAQVESPLLRGYAPVLGAYGLTYGVALFAAAITIMLGASTQKLRLALVGLVFGVGLVGLALGERQWSQPIGPAVAVSLLQGNVEQVLKWREGEREKALENYLDLAQKHPATLIVLPETALPMSFERLPIDYLANLKQSAPADGAVIVGAVTRNFRDNGFDYFNTGIALNRSTTEPAEQRYSKSHLVAFGEFVPPTFSWAYRWLNIPMAVFRPAATSQAPMTFTWGRAALNICYEDAFGHEIIRQLPDANVLVNLTNVAWFGRSIAADQHAQFSQMRALETARYMLRATNTGVTAIIDAQGRIVSQLPQFSRGALVGTFVPMTGRTPYLGWGDWPVLLGCLTLAGFAAFRTRTVRVQSAA